MKNKMEYAQELKDLMEDLTEAISNKKDSKVQEVVSQARVILDDVEEADFK